MGTPLSDFNRWSFLNSLSSLSLSISLPPSPTPVMLNARRHQGWGAVERYGEKCVCVVLVGVWGGYLSD